MPITPDLDGPIADAARAAGLDLPTLRAQIEHESEGDPLAIGDGGRALGLMQVHRAAATEVGGDWDALAAAIAAGDRLRAAELSLAPGTRYMAKMLKARGGAVDWALGSYNQGEAEVGPAHRYALAVLALVGKA